MDLAIFVTARLLSRAGHLPAKEEKGIFQQFKVRPQQQGQGTQGGGQAK